MGYNRIFFGYINQLYPSISPVCIPRDAAFHFPIFPSVDPLSFKEPEPVPTIFRQKKKALLPRWCHQIRRWRWSNYCPIPRRKESSTPPTYAGFKLVGGMALLKSDCELHLHFPFRFHALQRSWSVSENVVCSTLKWQRWWGKKDGQPLWTVDGCVHVFPQTIFRQPLAMVKLRCICIWFMVMPPLHV